MDRTFTVLYKNWDFTFIVRYKEIGWKIYIYV